MTRKSGVSGKTVPALARSMNTAKRLAALVPRTAAEQLKVLDRRPGNASRERRRLLARIAAETAAASQTSGATPSKGKRR